MADVQLQTRLKEGMAFLAKQQYDQAKDYYNDLLDEYPESAQCYYGLMMAELKVNNLALLEKVEIHIGDLTSFKRALHFSEPAFRARLEAIQQKNEEYIRSKLDKSNASFAESETEAKHVFKEEPDSESEQTQKPEPVPETEQELITEAIQKPESTAVCEKSTEPEDGEVIVEVSGDMPADDVEYSDNSSKSKIGLIAVILGIAVIATYFAVCRKVPVENTEQKVVRKAVKTEVSATIDLTKPTKFKAGSVEFEMMPCQAGSFMMGSPENELGHDNQEVLHQVTISKPFLIGKYEVTQALYSEVTGYNNSKYYGLDNPVESVSYDEAAAFCKKLNELTVLTRPADYRFDIPTEAQWEYACRAGSSSAINNGKELTSDASFCGNLDDVAWYTYNAFGITHPVGLKKPNAWGIYDMHGNVAEWCRDWYYEDYNLNAKTDPIVDKSAHSRVVRGGNFVVVPYKCRSACRNMAPADSESISLGFRIVLVSDKL